MPVLYEGLVLESGFDLRQIGLGIKVNGGKFLVGPFGKEDATTVLAQVQAVRDIHPKVIHHAANGYQFYGAAGKVSLQDLADLDGVGGVDVFAIHRFVRGGPDHFAFEDVVHSVDLINDVDRDLLAHR